MRILGYKGGVRILEYKERVPVKGVKGAIIDLKPDAKNSDSSRQPSNYYIHLKGYRQPITLI